MIKYRKYTQELELEAIQKINKEVPSLFPETMKTTISFIDKQNKSESKFQHFTPNNLKEIYDLDHLI
jgi:hypothetical protein